ncbi:Hydroxyacid oxidase 1 [Holothuria leucospilota]|uniref:(S)-2-hydroxy-acid oxidase n=1 Tax=Holothuria leucospilota TaxID=206669 RepID=A0A9Q1BIW6_HOLLE|nr:Hydroxyacid oxidase 1 [Holothuria leucospilota]
MASNAPPLDCLDDYERLAKEKMTKDKRLQAVWSYFNIGTGSRQTLDDSIASFARFRFQPRILTAKRERSTWTTLLGNPVSIPIGISPAAGYSWIHPDGDAAGGKAAARAGTVQILTSVGDLSIEDFAAKVPDNGLYWAQTYLFRDKRNTLRLVKNAERLGFKAIVVTVDSPVEHKGSGLTRDEIKALRLYQTSTFRTPNVRYIAGVERDPKPLPIGELWTDGIAGHYETFCCADWDDLAWLQSQTNLPIVLKGILTAESALQAAKTGICGILVSAHGGRQLDGVPAPLDALPEIVDAVKGTNIEVYMDGGVRTGNDVVKALALGARAVFIGRPALFGLIVNGEDGIFQVLKILEKELSICMALCGCSSLKEITRSIVKHESQFHSKL